MDVDICKVGYRMAFASGFVFFCTVYRILACENTCLTIGVIAEGAGVIERETLSQHGKTVVMVEILIDTTEAYDIFRAVQTLDVDSDVDVIVLVDYDVSILRIPQILSTNNKKLLKMGARTSPHHNAAEIKRSDELQTPSCNRKGDFVIEKPEDTFCIADWNVTSLDKDEMQITMLGPRAIRSIVKSLQWKHIAIFYDSSTEEETSVLVDDLSKDGVLFMLFDVEQIENLQRLLLKIYNKRIEMNKELQIVIVCKIHNTRKILKSANEFDSMRNHKTLLKKFSRWMIVSQGYGSKVAEDLKEYASDLDNVVSLEIPKQQPIDFEVLCVGVESILLDILREETSNTSHLDFKTNFIDRLQSWTPSRTCQAYHIHTLLWTNKGREFSSVGYADIQGNIVVNSDIFPNAKYGYNKRRFLVSTLAYQPFVIKRKVNNTYIYEGFCMDLLKELAHTLNFTFDLTEPKDKKWGSVTNKINLTFNGLIGQLQREEIDIVAAPISRQAEREPVMDSSYPYFYAYTTVLVKKPDINATKWRTLINPFKWEVLATIAVSLVSVTILAFLLEKSNPFYDVPKYAKERKKKGGLHTWHSSFWYVFGALLCQGGVHLPESTSGRTLISCWWLTCIIIVGTYCGNLIAFLTVTKEHPSFNSLQEMLKLKGTYKWGTLGGTFWEMTIPDSSNPTYRAVGEAFLQFNKSDPTILHRNPAFHVNRVKSEKYAWIGDKTYIEISMAKECSLMKIKEEFMLLRYVFGFINNSPHTPAFSEQMMKIHEGGLFEIWKRKWWPQSNFCAGNSIPEAKPISLLDVQSAFYVCLIGIFFGSIAFLIEIGFHKYWMKKKELDLDAKNRGQLSDRDFVGITLENKRTRL